MKTRHGFVSNSSSSSFTIPLVMLTGLQLHQILEHGSLAGNDAWSIDTHGYVVTGYTLMDNFDMRYFLSTIGIPNDAVVWGG